VKSVLSDFAEELLWNLSPTRALMPIRAYLDDHEFDGETIPLMGIAFEMAIGSFDASPCS
jgi:hypothetical protein